MLFHIHPTLYPSHNPLLALSVLLESLRIEIGVFYKKVKPHTVTPLCPPHTPLITHLTPLNVSHNPLTPSLLESFYKKYKNERIQNFGIRYMINSTCLWTEASADPQPLLTAPI
jgi:hypothetical protein